jgi:hypothetical protein
VRKRVIAVLGALSQNACRTAAGQSAYLERPGGSPVVAASRSACQEDSQGRIVRKPPKWLRPTVTEEFYLVPAPRLGRGNVMLTMRFRGKTVRFCCCPRHSLPAPKRLPSGANPAVRPAAGPSKPCGAEFPARCHTLRTAANDPWSGNDLIDIRRIEKTIQLMASGFWPDLYRHRTRQIRPSRWYTSGRSPRPPLMPNVRRQGGLRQGAGNRTEPGRLLARHGCVNLPGGNRPWP